MYIISFGFYLSIKLNCSPSSEQLDFTDDVIINAIHKNDNNSNLITMCWDSTKLRIAGLVHLLLPIKVKIDDVSV